MKKAAKITTRPMTSDDWEVLERLFGPKGVGGGCWCMIWRLPRGGQYYETHKGRKNKQAFKRLVETGKATGCLAFAADEPVGWCSVAPHDDFPYFQRTRVLSLPAPSGAWSVTCFYVPARWRGHGVASKLLAEAVELARERGASCLDGYPVKLKQANSPYPAAFAWTGVPNLFERTGFKDIAPQDHPRPVYRKTFRQPKH